MATLPEQTDLSMFHSDGAVFGGTVTEDTGSAADLTASGATLVFTLARLHGTTALLTKSLSSGIVGLVNGSYTITVDDSDVDTLDHNHRYFYDLIYTKPSAAYGTTVAWGWLTIKGSVGG